MALSIHASLATPYRLDSPTAFERIMATWRKAAPTLLPTHAQSDEPVRLAFDPDDLTSALPYWMNGVWYGRRNNPTLSVNVFTDAFLHSNLLVDVDRPDPVNRGLLHELILELASILLPDYGMVHPLTVAEIAEAHSIGRPDLMTLNRVTGKAIVHAGFTRQLQKGLPTLFWGNLFGPSYVALFGRTRLRAAPAAVVREEPWGMYLQLTAEPPSEETWTAYRARRDEVVEYLGRDAFWPGATRIASAMRDFEPAPLPSP